MQGDMFKTVMTNLLKIGQNSKTLYKCTDFVNEVMLELGITKDLSSKNDIKDILDLTNRIGLYDKEPIVLKNEWYKYLYPNEPSK